MMFRTALPLRQLKRLSFTYHTTSAVQTKPSRKFVPKDWYIIEAGPGGGIELDFVNSKTREATWYTPEGMTAEEILEIPGAKKYWSTVEVVQKYIDKKAEEKRATDGWDLIDEMPEFRDWKPPEEKKD